MKRSILFLVFLLFCKYVFAEVVYFTNTPTNADIRAEKVDVKAMADRVIYVTNYRSEARQKGIWYITNYIVEADLRVWMGNGPIKVYFTHNKWEVK